MTKLGMICSFVVSDGGVIFVNFYTKRNTIFLCQHMENLICIS